MVNGVSTAAYLNCSVDPESAVAKPETVEMSGMPAAVSLPIFKILEPAEPRTPENSERLGIDAVY